MTNNKFVRGIVAALLIGTASTAAAYDAYGPWTKVDQIFAKAEGGAPYVYFDANAMPGCYDDRSGYLGHGGDETNQIYSTLLTALVAERDVQVYYDFIPNGSGWSTCRIRHIYIK